MASDDLTPQASAGYGAELGELPAHKVCPFFDSSPAAMAWLVGAWLKQNGRAALRAVRMSRGYTVRVDGMLVSVANAAQLVQLK